jgi:hypothetical protein
MPPTTVSYKATPPYRRNNGHWNANRCAEAHFTSKAAVLRRRSSCQSATLYSPYDPRNRVWCCWSWRRNTPKWTVVLFWLLLFCMASPLRVVLALDSIETVRSTTATSAATADNADEEYTAETVVVTKTESAGLATGGALEDERLWGSGTAAAAAAASASHAKDSKEDAAGNDDTIPTLQTVLGGSDDSADSAAVESLHDDQIQDPTDRQIPVMVFSGTFQQQVIVESDTTDESMPILDDNGNDDRHNIRAWGTEAKLDLMDSVKVSSTATMDPTAKPGSDTNGTTSSKRLWGADHHLAVTDNNAMSAGTGTNHTKAKSEQQPPTNPHIPFVKSKPTIVHNGQKGSRHQAQHRHPPDGFTLTARVYIDSADNLAHFDYESTPDSSGDDDDTTRHCSIALPYFDCGALGSTTAALPVKHAYFRHALSAPTVWTSPDRHATLAIALSPYRMELDSGEVWNGRAGDVILLEDAIRPGHRIVAADKQHAVSIMFVTLTKPHYHIGKQHLSLQKAIAKSLPPPCPDEYVNATKHSPANATDPNQVSETNVQTQDFVPRNTMVGSSWDMRRLRLIALGTVALSLSTLMADFLAKTAPLWLAVGIGGTCFVVGATYGLTVAADYAFTTLDVWRERQRLERQGGH